MRCPLLQLVVVGCWSPRLSLALSLSLCLFSLSHSDSLPCRRRVVVLFCSTVGVTAWMAMHPMKRWDELTKQKRQTKRCMWMLWVAR